MIMREQHQQQQQEQQYMNPAEQCANKSFNDFALSSYSDNKPEFQLNPIKAEFSISKFYKILLI